MAVGSEFTIDAKSWTRDADWQRLTGGSYVTVKLEERIEPLLLLLSKGHLLTAKILDQTYSIDLVGSGKAIRTYNNCLS